MTREVVLSGLGTDLSSTVEDAWDTGELVFDDDEFIYMGDRSRVPGELRPLFDAAWHDVEDEDANVEEHAGPLSTGLAMAEIVTGLELTEGLASLRAAYTDEASGVGSPGNR